MIVDNTVNAFFERGCAEIDEKPWRHFHAPEVGEQLFAMHGHKVFNRLQLDNQLVFHDQIRTETLVKRHPSKRYRNRFLAHDTQTALLKQLGQNRFMHRFKQARPQLLVKVKGGIGHNR